MNRRTVVDQATDDATRLLKLIYASGCHDNLSWAARQEPGDQPTLTKQHTAAILRLRKAITSLAADDSEPPLAVSTLRGQFADKGEWSADPARPAIIVGTVDMIGSRLLFSGYGRGFKHRPLHAGFLGQDTLLIHDEAHLEPAFSRLIWSIELEQRREHARSDSARDVTHPLYVMELSATARLDPKSEREKAIKQRPTGGAATFGLEKADLVEQIIQDRLCAAKRLMTTPVENGVKETLPNAIVKQAKRYDDMACRVLIYVRLPETARTVVRFLRKEIGIENGTQDEVEKRIGLLTGTIRGHEREKLVNSDLFAAFRSDPKRAPLGGPTVYLVSTSAGEVGVDLDADHLVCDLTTLDSMAQRFGRVNRLGGKDRRAEITVVLEKSKDANNSEATTKSETGADDSDGDKKSKPAKHALDSALAKTAEILREIEVKSGDVSPSALKPMLESHAAEFAFSPQPKILPATDILFDVWALTTIREKLPGRPPVADWLHGVAEWEPPETQIAAARKPFAPQSEASWLWAGASTSWWDMANCCRSSRTTKSPVRNQSNGNRERHMLGFHLERPSLARSTRCSAATARFSTA